MFFNRFIKKQKVGILCICTGKYICFFDEFYTSCELNFLCNYEKHYYVFTDSEIKNEHVRVHRIEQRKLGWPYDTLMRFHMFDSIGNVLVEMDYLFFFNINMVFNSNIGTEVLPSSQHNYLAGVKHPGYYRNKINDFPYERCEDSTACISIGEGKYYYQGCLSGGRTYEYLEMCTIIKTNINLDLENGIIATWHDESHLNKFYLDKKIRTLSPSYAYPELLNLPFKKRIIQLDKSKLGGHNFLRS